MFQGNVIYVDFRFPKDVQEKQELSFPERMKAHSERTTMFRHRALPLK